MLEVEGEVDGRSMDGYYIVEETRPKGDAYHDISSHELSRLRFSNSTIGT